MMGKWKEFNSEAPGFIYSHIHSKFSDAIRDPRIGAIVILELILISVLVIGIIVYLDPEVNLVPFPENVIGFATVLILTIFLYRYSKEFRKERKASKK